MSLAMTRKAAEGCCGDATWRGRFCSFHQGYEAGMDALLVAGAGEIECWQCDAQNADCDLCGGSGRLYVLRVSESVDPHKEGT